MNTITIVLVLVPVYTINICFRSEEPTETRDEEPSQEQVETTHTSCEPELSLSMDIVPSPPPTSRVCLSNCTLVLHT